MVAWPLSQASISLDSGFPEAGLYPGLDGIVSHQAVGNFPAPPTFSAPPCLLLAGNKVEERGCGHLL